MKTDLSGSPPSDWETQSISHLAIIDPRYPVEKGRDYPFVEMSSVAENFGGITKFDCRRNEGSGLTRFMPGDTLFAKIVPCPENGKIAYAPETPAGLCLGSTEFIVLSPRDTASRRFLYHLACSNDVRGRAIARYEGSTGRQRVPNDVFEKRLKIPIPPVREQAAIARVLDAVDTSIEKIHHQHHAQQRLRRASIDDLMENVPGSKQKLGDYISDVRYGTSQASNEKDWGLPTLRIPNVIGDQVSFDDLVFVEVKPADQERLKLSDGDLLIVRTNGNPNYVGRSAVFNRPDDREWILASYLIRVRLSPSISAEYVNVVLGSPTGRKEILRRVTTSAGNNNINANSIRLTRIPVPNDPRDQQRIVAVSVAFQRMLKALEEKLDALAMLKKALMQDLLTGRHRIPPEQIERLARP